MQLNRHSPLVRWYLFAAFRHTEEEKQQALAETTNLCMFVRWLVLGTLARVVIAAVLIAMTPFAWVVSVFATIAGALVGYVPVGWGAGLDSDWMRWLFPAMAFRWEQKVGVRVGTRTIFPHHVLGIALAVLGCLALIHVEALGWSGCSMHVGWLAAHMGWITAHVTVFMLASLIAAVVLYAKLRNAEGWRVFAAWLKAKKDRVCPRIEFV